MSIKKEEKIEEKQTKSPFVILSKREKNMPVWITVPGYEVQFQVVRPTRSRTGEVFAKSNKILKDGDRIVFNEDGSAPRLYFDSAEYNKQVERFNVEHVNDFRGNDLVDTNGKPLKFSQEALIELLDMYGNVEVESYYTDTKGKQAKRTLMIWLFNEICKPDNYIKGDSKNLNAS